MSVRADLPSSFSLREIEGAGALSVRPERVLILHFVVFEVGPYT